LNLGLFIWPKTSIRCCSTQSWTWTCSQINKLGIIGRVLIYFQQRFLSITSKWTKAFHDIEGTHLLVTSDITKLSQATNQLLANIGSSDPSAPANVTLWDSIKMISSSLQLQLSDQTQMVSQCLASIEVDNGNTRALLQEMQDGLHSIN
jgi:hypothetical protein